MLNNLLERIRLAEEVKTDSYFSREDLDLLFERIDSSRDQFIDKHELKEFLVSHNLLATQKEQDFLFGKFDMDYDNRIKLSDLYSYFLY